MAGKTIEIETIWICVSNNEKVEKTSKIRVMREIRTKTFREDIVRYRR